MRIHEISINFTTIHCVTQDNQKILKLEIHFSQLIIT